MNIYLLKDLNYFLTLLEAKITLKVGSYHESKIYEQVSSHRASFYIKEEDLANTLGVSDKDISKWER